MTEVERLRLLAAKQEVEIARLKKDIGLKELVQTGNMLLAAERLYFAINENFEIIACNNTDNDFVGSKN